MKASFVSVLAIVMVIALLPIKVTAQQYKLRQATTMGGMKVESTIYVKGSRKRTETGGMMGMGGSVTIEQCDLKRTVKINDEKKLYFIEPFSQRIEDLPDRNKAEAGVPADQRKPNRKGGVITMWYSISHTGERKKMFGFTARHVWTSQKMKPSLDACTMKDSILIKTDGWYIDLPEFNCPVSYEPSRKPAESTHPDCVDSFVIHQQGSGKLGFPLIQIVTIVSANSKTEFQTRMETIELSTATLDSMLFGIPPGYQLAKSEAELQDKMDAQDMMKAMENNKNINEGAVKEDKAAGTIRIGVIAPAGNDQVQKESLQQHLVGLLTNGGIEAVAVKGEEEAGKMNCDYVLTSTFLGIKEQDKAKGLLKVITRRDPNAMTSYNVRADIILKALKNGSIRSQQSIDGKYEGRIDEAAAKALDEGCERVLNSLRN